MSDAVLRLSYKICVKDFCPLKYRLKIVVKNNKPIRTYPQSYQQHVNKRKHVRPTKVPGGSLVKDHIHWMQEAIAEAKKAEEIGEVPIGAVIVKNGEVIGRGHNMRETIPDPTAHAEMIAIREASRRIGAWRMLDSTLYVTLEPCPMCAGAIVQARVPVVVFGTPDPKAGCAGTLMNLLQEQRFNHQVELIDGVLQEQCGALLTNFFHKLRSKKKNVQTGIESDETR